MERSLNPCKFNNERDTREGVGEDEDEGKGGVGGFRAGKKTEIASS